MYNAFPVTTIVALITLQSTGFSQLVLANHDESVEPSSTIKLVIDGKQLDTQIGQETQLSLDDRAVRVLVTEGDERELKLRHLRFQYPGYFKFEVKFKKGTQIPVRWDLEGHDADITVYRVSCDQLRGKNVKRPLDEWMSKAFNSKMAVTDARVLELGGMKIQGTRYSIPINLDLIDTKMSFDVFEVPGSFGDVRYFLLLSGWDGDNPEEEQLARNLLRKSFKVEKSFTKLR